MNLLPEDQKWPIAEKFRASADLTDEAAFALLAKNDAEQKELGARINAPFMSNTPQERERSKAYITLESLLGQKKLAPVQKEQVAEAYAAIGRYDLASQTSKLRKKEYVSIWKAVFADGNATCEHPDEHRYVKARIFSIKESRELSLIACNICGRLTVSDTPDHLARASQSRHQHRGQTSGMSIQQALEYHKNHVSRG